MKTSFINTIRLSLSNMLAPSCIKIDVPPGTKSLTTPRTPRHIEEQKPLATEYKGQFHASHLQLLNSNYLRNAISQLGAWSSMKNAFNEYEATYGNKRKSQAKLEKFVEEFHAWNDAATDDREMQEADIVETAKKLCTPKPQKSSKEADAIIAEIRKCSVEQLKAKRQENANKVAKKREELFVGFVALMLDPPKGSDIDPSMPHASVANKAIQTLTWITNQNWDGDYIAGEVLQIKGDLAIIEKAAHTEDLKQGAGYADKYVEARRFGDESERNEVERPLNPVISPEDHEAFLTWQAAQHQA